MNIVTVSPGNAVTAADVAMFDATWTQPDQHELALNNAYWWLYNRLDMMAWETGDRMAVLVRMYELTHERRYLDQLQGFIEHALKFRDDRHPGDIENTGQDLPVQPFDEFRGRVMPAWGGKSVNSGGKHAVSEDVSSMYAYPLAALARIVAEEPALHRTYGNAAVGYINAVLETVLAFIPGIQFREAGGFVEAYLTHPASYQAILTKRLCADACEEAINGEPEKRDRWEGMKKNCNDRRKLAGHPLPHNQNFAFAMVLIELWRALDSAFYQQSPARSRDAELTRNLLPLLVSRQQRYFVNRLKTVGKVPNLQRFYWHSGDDLASGVNYHPEDTNHGALVMRYLDLLWRNNDRLNESAAAAGEPIPLDSSHLRRFANTFLQKIAAGTNFARNIVGDTAKPPESLNGESNGWMNLSRF